MASPFQTAAQHVKTVAATALSPGNIKGLVGKYADYNQAPYPTNKLMRSLSESVGMPVAGLIQGQATFASGILVGWTKMAVDPYNARKLIQGSTWYPIIYSETPIAATPTASTSTPLLSGAAPTPTPKGVAAIRRHYTTLEASEAYTGVRKYLTPTFNLINEYLAARHKLCYEEQVGKVQGVQNEIRVYDVDSSDPDVGLNINVRDLSRSTHDPAARGNLLRSGDENTRKNILQDQVAFSLSIGYAGYLEHSELAHHYLATTGASTSSKTPQDVLKGQQDFVPTISFNTFTKFFAPEDVDNFAKVFDYYTDNVLNGLNRSTAEILSSGWKGIVTDKRALRRTQEADQQNVVDLSAEYENLRIKLLNFICAFGIKHVHKNGMDIILYNNDVLEKLIDRFKIPPRSTYGSKRVEYERYERYNWHKYLIAKLLLPAYIIEKDGRIALPIEAYIHHEAVQSKVGKVGAPTSFGEKKFQSELRAFTGALQTAMEYVDTASPDDIVTGLHLALM